MSVLSIPNVFVTGTTINAAPFNTNFNAVATSVNSIDNTNIGSSGLYPSQLIPTSLAQATFGGLLGYLHLAPSASTTPLTVSGIAGQSADIFDVTLTSGGVVPFKVDSIGRVTIASQSAANVPLTVSGVSGQSADIFDITLTSGGVKALSVTSAGSLYASALSALSAPSAVASGDIVAQRSASTGVLFLGGASGASLDYGTTAVGQLTMSAKLAVNGSITSVGNIVALGASASIAATALGAVSVPVLASAGDLVAQRTNASGSLILGGASADGKLDFGTTQSAQFTFSAPLNVTGAIAAFPSSFSAPAVYAAGDVVAQRTSGAGALFMGGSVTAYAIDGGLFSAGNISLSKNNVSLGTFNGSTGIYTASDQKLKENIVDFSDGSDVIRKLRTRSFQWISTGASDVGYIAQEVQPILPGAVIVMDDKTGQLGLNQVAFLPYLIEAFQKLDVAFTAYVAAHP